jgi:hypothetical protein
VADHDAALREVAALVSAVLRNSPPALGAEIRPVASRLGNDARPEAVENLLRETAATCLCGISRGAPRKVTPYACPVHGTPCDECGGLESCKPGCGLGYAPVDSGRDSDGTPWAVAASIPGMIVSVGSEDVLLKGEQRDRFAEAVARAVTPGQVSRKRGNHGPGCGCTPCKAEWPDEARQAAQAAGTEDRHG